MNLDQRGDRGADGQAGSNPRVRWARSACVAVLAFGLPAAAFTATMTEMGALRLRFALVLVGILSIVAALYLNRPSAKRPWILLAFGLTLSLTGDAIVLSVSVDGVVTSNVPADAWLTSLAGLLILGAMFDATRIVRGNDHGGTLDAVVLALAAGTAVWHLGVVANAVPGWAGGGTEIAGSLQILFLVAVFGLLVRTARVLPRESRAVMVLLAVGLLSALGAFLLGAFREASGDIGSHYAGARAAYGAAANLMAGAAALHPSMRNLTERAVPPVDRMSLARTIALGLALLVPPGLLATAELRGVPGSPTTLFVAWAVLVPTVLARIRLLGVARDDAWRRATSTEQRMASLVANTGDALLVVHRRSHAADHDAPHEQAGASLDAWSVSYASPASWRQLGRHPHQLEGHDLREVVDEEDWPVVDELLSSAAPMPRSADVQAAGYSADAKWLEVIVDALPPDDVPGLVLTVRDVTDRKRAEIHWEHAAISDVLTGLLNRRGIEARLEAAFEQALADESMLGIIVADLDGFKQINDTHGHVVGDEVLRQVASRLMSAVRADDDVGRIGGDEFVVVSRDLDSPEALLRMAERMPDVIRQPIHVDRLELTVYISIGVALADVERDSSGQLIRRADAALYAAKAAGHGSVVVADDAVGVSDGRSLLHGESRSGGASRAQRT
ncbi:MAG: sensor domain-containing diguanylate cyclase [Nitriliruptoraceae bacterium]